MGRHFTIFSLVLTLLISISLVAVDAQTNATDTPEKRVELDLSVTLLTKSAETGTEPIIEVDLFNTGETAQINDILIMYVITHVESGSIMITRQEIVSIGTEEKIRKKVHVPVDAPPGEYVVKVNATYLDGTKSAAATETFDVFEAPLFLKVLRMVFLNWITYVVIFILFVIILFRRSRHKHKPKKTTRRRKKKRTDVRGWLNLTYSGGFTEAEKQDYAEIIKYIDQVEGQLHQIEKKGVDTSTAWAEIEIIRDSLRHGFFTEAEIHADSLTRRVEALVEGMAKMPPKKPGEAAKKPPQEKKPVPAKLPEIKTEEKATSKEGAEKKETVDIGDLADHIGKEVTVEGEIEPFKRRVGKKTSMYWYKAKDKTGKCVVMSSQEIKKGSGRMTGEVGMTGKGNIYLSLRSFE